MVLITSQALSLLSLRMTPCITILQRKKHISVMTEFKAHALILCTVLPFRILAIRKKPCHLCDCGVTHVGILVVSAHISYFKLSQPHPPVLPFR